MRKIRVLIVDDSVVVRKMLADVLAAEPALDIVGSASNGRIALQKIPQVNPDLITLDLEMPEMDGLATLKEIRRSYPRIPVIMFSMLTARGADATLDALAAGASDCVCKPTNMTNAVAAMQNIREQMIPKIRALCPFAENLPWPTQPLDPSRRFAAQNKTNAKPRKVNEPIEIVTIGVSTGGPNALSQLLPQLPADFPVPIVIVQHMPPIFTKQLALRLDKISPLQVREAEAGAVLYPGEVWIAPGDFHLVVGRQGGVASLALQQGPPENSCRPAADVLFQSVVDTFGARTLGVVMTGMGQDGLRGCERIRDAGGRILVQDEASSVVWGMPGTVARAGLADNIVPLDRLAIEIDRDVRKSRNSLSSFSLVAARGQQ
ncbi:MAG TPA: chemotaxis response regulator protein-glutamate methylesterase [Pirellulales bacterium]|jgi:two-component system chemotaxis response regulator CheB|nr:chemotaxis response regulator protein-glutamate methylesterase [Pirellulales bacterium]